MAISKLKPRHASEGRSIAAVLAERIDYSKNPEKTDGGLLVTPKDIDSQVNDLSKVIGYAISMALQPGMALEELELLLS